MWDVLCLAVLYCAMLDCAEIAFAVCTGASAASPGYGGASVSASSVFASHHFVVDLALIETYECTCYGFIIDVSPAHWL